MTFIEKVHSSFDNPIYHNRTEKRMIRTCFTLLFCLSLFTAWGQEQPKPLPETSLKLGYGTTFLGAGNLFGTQTYGELHHFLLRPIGVGLSGSYTRAEQFNAGVLEQRANAFQGNLEVTLTPFRNSVNALSLGGGLSFLHLDQTTFGNDGQGTSSDSIPSQTAFGELGFGGHINYDIYIVKHIIIGSRLSYHRFTTNGDVFLFGFHVGFAF